MPFTVITMKKVPNSLRGDLTRWMQEVSTGVYVGNFNSKVREYLWQRVCDAVSQGEATICYSCRNEIGYSFESVNAQRQVVDYDGIPLIVIPQSTASSSLSERGFSNASKLHRARRYAKPYLTHNDEEDGIVKEKKEEKVGGDRYVFLDIETTGLDVNSDSIIEIGAISSVSAPLHFLVKIDKPVPETIVGITGITDSLLKSEGKDLRSCLKALISFTDGKILVGYNIGFDIKFLNHALSELGVGALNNRYIDLMKEAKRRNLFQNNYRFVTTLKEYGVNGEIQHRALEDAKLAHELFVRMGMGE